MGVRSEFSIYFNVGIRHAPIVKFWDDTDVSNNNLADTMLFISPFVPGKQTLTPHARTHADMHLVYTHTRTSYTRTHNDTGRGFYDLYEINLFVSTTATSTFNIKIISTWA